MIENEYSGNLLLVVEQLRFDGYRVPQLIWDKARRATDRFTSRCIHQTFIVRPLRWHKSKVIDYFTKQHGGHFGIVNRRMSLGSVPFQAGCLDRAR